MPSQCPGAALHVLQFRTMCKLLRADYALQFLVGWLAMAGLTSVNLVQHH